MNEYSKPPEDDKWLEEGEEYSITALRAVCDEESVAGMSRRSCCSLPKRFNRIKPLMSICKDESFASSSLQEESAPSPLQEIDPPLQESAPPVPKIHSKEQGMLKQRKLQVEQAPTRRRVDEIKRQPRGHQKMRRSRSWEKRQGANDKTPPLSPKHGTNEPDKENPPETVQQQVSTLEPSYTKIPPQVEVKKTKNQEILNYPGLTVSKVERHTNEEEKFGSLVLEVSVKKSLLQNNNKTVTFDDDETLLTTVKDNERLAALVAETEQSTDGELENLINGVIFKLKSEDKKRNTIGPPSKMIVPRDVQFVYDDDGFLSTNCDVQKFAERQVSTLVNEVDDLHNPCDSIERKSAALLRLSDSHIDAFAGSFNDAVDTFNCMREDEPYFPPSSSHVSSRESDKTSILVKEFIIRKHGNEVVSPLSHNHSDNSLLQQPRRSPGGVLYDDESMTATYDDDTYTMDDTYYTMESYEDTSLYNPKPEWGTPP